MNAPLAPHAMLAPAIVVPRTDPSEVLRRKMHQAVLIEKTLYAGGRLGRFVLRVSPGVLGDYQAGQYIGIGLDTPDGFVVRSYSIAGSPLDREHLELYIALVSGGRLTPTLFAQEIGSTWHHLTPKGHFTLKKAAARRLVMVATGTGLAPFISQIRTLWRMHRSGVPVDHHIVVIHGASYADELIYREEFERYAAARGEGFDLTYIPTASRPDAAGHGWSDAIGRGRVNDLVRWLAGCATSDAVPVALPAGCDRAAIIHRLGLDDAAHTTWLACGNPLMIEDLRAVAHQEGIAGFLAEEFWKG